jgi:hypothetical protein
MMERKFMKTSRFYQRTLFLSKENQLIMLFYIKIILTMKLKMEKEED